MIERTAILHTPLSEYAFTSSETNLTIRLRCAKGNLLQCTLYYGDRVQPSEPIKFTPLPMQQIAEDLYFDYYEVSFESPFSRVCYYFSLSDGEEVLYLYAGLLESELPLERSEFYQYPFLRREEISDVPDWFKHAVVYNIFPDSFATGKRFCAKHLSTCLCQTGVSCTAGTAERFAASRKIWTILPTSALIVCTSIPSLPQRNITDMIYWIIFIFHPTWEQTKISGI